MVPLVNLLVDLIVAGVGLWLINSLVPMPSGAKKILNVVVVLAVGIWVLQSTGLWSPLSGSSNLTVENDAQAPPANEN